VSSWITNWLTYIRDGWCFRRKYFEHSRTYTNCFSCRNTTSDRVFNAVRETKTFQPVRGLKTRMFDTSVPGQRLSWLLNFERQLIRPRSHSVKWRVLLWKNSSFRVLFSYRKIKVFCHNMWRDITFNIWCNITFNISKIKSPTIQQKRSSFMYYKN